MKKITSILFIIFLLFSCRENTKIGKYTKEALPENFYYEIEKAENIRLRYFELKNKRNEK